jgi:hypothetical protein
MAIGNLRNVADNTTSADEGLDAGRPSWSAAAAIALSVIEAVAQLLAYAVRMMLSRVTSAFQDLVRKPPLVRSLVLPATGHIAYLLSR